MRVCRFVAGGNPADAAGQLKSVIKALHAAGIEVLLEVRGCGLHSGQRLTSDDMKWGEHDGTACHTKGWESMGWDGTMPCL